jgi:hypothetical protein
VQHDPNRPNKLTTKINAPITITNVKKPEIVDNDENKLVILSIFVNLLKSDVYLSTRPRTNNSRPNMKKTELIIIKNARTLVAQIPNLAILIFNLYCLSLLSYFVRKISVVFLF